MRRNSWRSMSATPPAHFKARRRNKLRHIAKGVSGGKANNDKGHGKDDKEYRGTVWRAAIGLAGLVQPRAGAFDAAQVFIGAGHWSISTRLIRVFQTS